MHALVAKLLDNERCRLPEEEAQPPEQEVEVREPVERLWTLEGRPEASQKG